MERGMVIEVSDISGEWEYMEQLGCIPRFRPGVMVEMVAKLPAEGPLTVIVDGKEYNIFPEMASSIYVKKIV
jgi:Fe2+ transport system protein FeoA